MQGTAWQCVQKEKGDWMNNQLVLEIVKINVYVLMGLIGITLILFFVFIRYKEHLKKVYAKKYQTYEAAVQQGIDENFRFPKRDAKVLLDVLLAYSERNHVNCAALITSLHLDRLLIHNLKYKDNKILAFKNIAISQIQGMYELLKEYWYSNDFEESYFSLYYTIYLGGHNQSYLEILQAVFQAKFSSDRKAEMIRFMALDNEILLDLCKQYSAYRTLLLAGINGEQLTQQQYQQIKEMGEENYIYVVKPLIVYGAYDLLREVVQGTNTELKRRIAFELKNKVCEDSFALLKLLIDDEDFTVRYNAAIGILMYDNGIQYLKEINHVDSSENTYNMAQLHLAMQKGDSI